MARRWWQFWRHEQPHAEGRLLVCGYLVAPGSQLYRRAVETLHLGPDGKLEEDVDVQLPEAEVIDRLVQEWMTLGRGAITDEQRQAMHRRETEIGQALHDLGGTTLMKHVVIKLIYAGLAHESDFWYWNDVGGYRY